MVCLIQKQCRFFLRGEGSFARGSGTKVANQGETVTSLCTRRVFFAAKVRALNKTKRICFWRRKSPLKTDRKWEKGKCVRKARPKSCYWGSTGKLLGKSFLTNTPAGTSFGLFISMATRERELALARLSSTDNIAFVMIQNFPSSCRHVHER